MCVTDCLDMTLVVIVALNSSVTKQPGLCGKGLKGLMHLAKKSPG